MKDKRYYVFGVNSDYVWVEYFEGTPSELLKENFGENINYSIKNIDIDLSKDELISKLNELNK